MVGTIMLTNIVVKTIRSVATCHQLKKKKKTRKLSTPFSKFNSQHQSLPKSLPYKNTSEFISYFHFIEINFTELLARIFPNYFTNKCHDTSNPATPNYRRYLF